MGITETQGFKNRILQGDSLEILKTLPDCYVNTCVTSPPYWGLRDYGVQGQVGTEPNLESYIKRLVQVFREVKRVLRKDGTLWLNLGDSYASGGRSHYACDNKLKAREMSGRPPTPNGLKPKDLIGIPWRVAFALQEDGWFLRSDIIWHKPNAMPESVSDRPTKAHEYIFLFSKSLRYFYDSQAIKEPYTQPNQGKRNKRTVWSVNTQPFRGAHFATFPSKLIEPCILAGSPEGGFVLDPFIGSGTTGMVALRNNRNFIGIEINPTYVEIAENRLREG